MFEMIKFLEYLKPSFASKPKGECSYFKSVSRKPNKWKKFTSSFLSNCIVFVIKEAFCSDVFVVLYVAIHSQHHTISDTFQNQVEEMIYSKLRWKLYHSPCLCPYRLAFLD